MLARDSSVGAISTCWCLRLAFDSLALDASYVSSELQWIILVSKCRTRTRMYLEPMWVAKARDHVLGSWIQGRSRGRRRKVGDGRGNMIKQEHEANKMLR